MTKRNADFPVSPSLNVRIGRVFEASATGWAILLVPIVLGAFLATAILLSSA